MSEVLVDRFRAAMESFFRFDRDAILNALKDHAPEYHQQYVENVETYIAEKGQPGDGELFEIFMDALEGMRSELHEISMMKEEIRWKKALAEHERRMRQSYKEGLREISKMFAYDEKEAGDLLEILETIHEPYSHGRGGTNPVD